MIEISPDYVLKSYGRFDETLTRPAQFKERVQELTVSFKNISTNYLNSLGDDAKITGQEKRALMDDLEKLLMIVVMLRRFDFTSEQTLIVIEKGNGHFRIQIRFVEHSIWELSGSISPEYKMKIGIFKSWFNEILSEDIRNFLTAYGNSAIDKEISTQEKEQIAKSLDRITIDLIEMIVYIERFMKFT